MTITYQVEHWNDIEDELLAYAPAHFSELALDQQDVPLDVDVVSYRDMDTKGQLHVVTTRDDDVLIGYHISILKTALHYRTTMHAFVDLYYLKPEYRHDRTGLGMFQFAEMRLKDIGVVKVFSGSKLHLFHDKLFLGLGYKPVEMLFTKLLQRRNVSE